MCKFNGALSEQQIEYLKNHGLSDKKIGIIQSFLKEHREGLTDYVDLVGDDLLPGPFFFYSMKKFGYLLDLAPENASSLEKRKLRAKVIIPIIQRFGKYFLRSNQIFENRNELLAFSKRRSELEKEGSAGAAADVQGLEYAEDPGIELPEEPVLWTMNHRFKDDVLASVLSVSRPFSLFTGSVPQFYNTIDGVLAYSFGTIVINRKSRESKKAGQEKAKKVIRSGLDIMMSPEGVWNKNPHKLLENFWPGVYRLAKETNSKVVPIVHYIYDSSQRIPKKENPIHTVIDDPMNITCMPEKEALSYYRDVMAKWYYIMMEKYGQTTRAGLLNGHENMQSSYEDIMNALISSVDRYDSKFEKAAAYHQKMKYIPRTHSDRSHRSPRPRIISYCSSTQMILF